LVTTRTVSINLFKHDMTSIQQMTNPAIEEIIEKLKKYPLVKYSSTNNAIKVEPKDEKGFVVSLEVKPGEIIVSSDVWHEHFDKDQEDEALNCFAFMLSNSCRLKIEYRGQKPKRWTIESFENGNWISDSTTGLFNFNFWSPKRTAYFQNNIIRTRDA
jgi:hypothetical protein